MDQLTTDDITALLNTPDAEGRYQGYYDQGHGVNEAEKIRQDLISMLYGWKCPDCVPTGVYCPTHALACEKIDRLAELAGATVFESAAG